MLLIGKMNPDSMIVGRNEIEQRHLEGDLLRVGDGRDQQAGRQRADQKQRQREQQRQPVPAHRQAEQHHRRRMMSAADASAMMKYGMVLPTMNENVSIGAIRTCSIVPTLLLAHDRQRGRGDGGDHRDVGDQSRDEEQRAAQLRVVPDARLDARRRRQLRRRPATVAGALAVRRMLPA